MTQKTISRSLFLIVIVFFSCQRDSVEKGIEQEDILPEDTLAIENPIDTIDMGIDTSDSMIGDMLASRLVGDWCGENIELGSWSLHSRNLFKEDNSSVVTITNFAGIGGDLRLVVLDTFFSFRNLISGISGNGPTTFSIKGEVKINSKVDQIIIDYEKSISNQSGSKSGTVYMHKPLADNFIGSYEGSNGSLGLTIEKGDKENQLKVEVVSVYGQTVFHWTNIIGEIEGCKIIFPEQSIHERFTNETQLVNLGITNYAVSIRFYFSAINEDNVIVKKITSRRLNRI